MDLSVYRSEFPITESYIYVNHASVSPLPRRVVGAMNDFAEDVMLFNGHDAHLERLGTHPPPMVLAEFSEDTTDFSGDQQSARGPLLQQQKMI